MTTKKQRASRQPAAHRDRSDDANAFLPDPYNGTTAKARTKDLLAEELAEDFVMSATGAEEVSVEARDQIVPEETGGPFVFTTAQQEFAQGTDASNPITAERAAFPTANRGK